MTIIQWVICLLCRCSISFQCTTISHNDEYFGWNKIISKWNLMLVLDILTTFCDFTQNKFKWKAFCVRMLIRLMFSIFIFQVRPIKRLNRERTYRIDYSQSYWCGDINIWIWLRATKTTTIKSITITNLSALLLKFQSDNTQRWIVPKYQRQAISFICRYRF